MSRHDETENKDAKEQQNYFLCLVNSVDRTGILKNMTLTIALIYIISVPMVNIE